MSEKPISEMSRKELREALTKARDRVDVLEGEVSGLSNEVDNLEHENDLLEGRLGQVVERPLFDRAIGLLAEVWKMDGGASLPASGDDLRRRVRDLLIDEGKI